MRLRFQADADLNHRIVAGLLRMEPTLDIRAATQASLSGIDDPAVLAYCADAGRVLVTHDQKTMPFHFAEFIARRHSPGVIVVPQHLPIGKAIEELYLAWAASDSEEWINMIRRIPF